MTFKHNSHRLLDAGFLVALGELANEPNGNWWCDVLQHPEVVLAVRRNSINAYYLGASLFRIDWKKGQVIPYSHVKYLLKGTQHYVPLLNGVFATPENSLQSAYKGTATLKEMCNAASRYAGVEKSGLHPMLVGNSNVIDTEIALTRQSADISATADDETVLSNARLDRIDAAIAILKDGVPTIRFYEAKHFTNSELRGSGETLPKVIGQIANYEKALNAHKAELSERYLDTARALVNFNNIRTAAFGESAAREIAPAIRQIAKTGHVPEIDPLPHLLIYGFDQAQRDDVVWNNHLNKLKDVLKERVRAIGKPVRNTKFIT